MWVDEGGIGSMGSTMHDADEDRTKIDGVRLHIV